MHRVVNAERADCGHHLRSVDQRQAFFCRKLDRGYPRAAHGLAARENLAAILRLTQADHRQHHVRQGNEVSACTEAAFFGNHGMHARVEHLEQRLHRGKTDAGETTDQRVEAKQHHAAHDLGGKRFSRAAGVAHDQIPLQLSCILVRNARIGELAKSGGETIDCLSALEHRLDMRAGKIDGFARFLRKLRRFPLAGHASNLFYRQRNSV